MPTAQQLEKKITVTSQYLLEMLKALKLLYSITYRMPLLNCEGRKKI